MQGHGAGAEKQQVSKRPKKTVFRQKEGAQRVRGERMDPLYSCVSAAGFKHLGQGNP